MLTVKAVPLMTRILVDAGLHLCQTDHRCPWFGPRRRVEDGDFVVDGARGDTCEAFNEMQVVGRSEKVALGGEVRRIDDQGVSVPSAPRVPAPLRDALAEMRTPIQGNDTSVVERLHHEHNVSGRLQNLEVTIEWIAGGARANPRHAWRDAPRVVVEILGT